ncbi:hypothetical protein CBR_g49781, partial [Chara braunii]
DPKGKKMKRHASHITDCGTTTLSASGVLLLEMDLQAIIGGRSVVETATSGPFSESIADSAAGESVYAGLVLTSASLIEPFLSKGLPQAEGVCGPQLIAGAEAHILLEDFSSNQLGRSASVDSAGEPGQQSLAFPAWMPMKVVAVVGIAGAEKGLEKLVEARGEGWDVGWALPVATMERSKRANEIAGGGHSTVPAIFSSGEGAGSTLDKLGHHSQTPFTWKPPSSQPSYGEGRDVRPNSAIGWEKEGNEMRIAILGFSNSEAHRHLLHDVSQHRHRLSTQLRMPAGIHRASNVRRGARVTACGSPFGVLSPHHFHNSAADDVNSSPKYEQISANAVRFKHQDEQQRLKLMEELHVLGKNAELAFLENFAARNQQQEQHEEEQGDNMEYGEDEGESTSGENHSLKRKDLSGGREGLGRQEGQSQQAKRQQKGTVTENAEVSRTEGSKDGATQGKEGNTQATGSDVRGQESESTNASRGTTTPKASVSIIEERGKLMRNVKNMTEEEIQQAEEDKRDFTADSGSEDSSREEDWKEESGEEVMTLERWIQTVEQLEWGRTIECEIRLAHHKHLRTRSRRLRLRNISPSKTVLSC